LDLADVNQIEGVCEVKNKLILMIMSFLVFGYVTANATERIIQGHPAIFAEMDRLFIDKNSPQTFVWANDIDGNDTNGDDGVVFTTIIPEDIIDFPPDAIYQVIKKAGNWELMKMDDGYGQTYMEVMAEVIDGLSGILVSHTNERCYITYWQ
jgi:hypothetical protein